MKRLKFNEARYDNSQFLENLLGPHRIVRGGVHPFAPGETAHPEPVHVHNTDEVFLFIQGKGILPIDGVDHPVETGDIVIVEAGEDHHTRSSIDEPLVAAWYVIESL